MSLNGLNNSDYVEGLLCIEKLSLSALTSDHHSSQSFSQRTEDRDGTYEQRSHLVDSNGTEYPAIIKVSDLLRTESLQLDNLSAAYIRNSQISITAGNDDTLADEPQLESFVSRSGPLPSSTPDQQTGSSHGKFLGNTASFLSNSHSHTPAPDTPTRIHPVRWPQHIATHQLSTSVEDMHANTGSSIVATWPVSYNTM
jgi:hypothetical protein